MWLKVIPRKDMHRYGGIPPVIVQRPSAARHYYPPLTCRLRDAFRGITFNHVAFQQIPECRVRGGRFKTGMTEKYNLFTKEPKILTSFLMQAPHLSDVVFGGVLETSIGWGAARFHKQTGSVLIAPLTYNNCSGIMLAGSF